MILINYINLVKYIILCTTIEKKTKTTEKTWIFLNINNKTSGISKNK